MRNKIIISCIFLFVALIMLTGMQTALAQDNTPMGLLKGNLDGVGTGVGQADVTGEILPELIGRILKTVIGVLGIILTILIIYGGYLYMTAGGEQKQAEKGMHYIRDAIIGLIICVLAYAITSFVILKIGGAIST